MPPYCKLRQFHISCALDSRRPLSEPLQNHVDSCPRCREFLAHSRALEARLAPSPADTPEWLHTRIMAGVRAATPGTTRDNRHPLFPAIAGFSAIAAAIAIINLAQNTPADPPGGTAGADLPQLTPVTPIHPASLPGRLEKRAELALSREFHNLATDITGARNFLSASLRSTLPSLGRD